VVPRFLDACSFWFISDNNSGHSAWRTTCVSFRVFKPLTERNMFKIKVARKNEIYLMFCTLSVSQYYEEANFKTSYRRGNWRTAGPILLWVVRRYL
jgi:hypothetical protein